MNEAQNFEQNRTEFINRLVAAGWTIEEAIAEWNSIQEDEEGNL